MRRGKAYVMTNLKTQTGLAEVVRFIEQRGMLAEGAPT
jgi:urease accessory protein